MKQLNVTRRIAQEELRYLASQRLFRFMALILGLALLASLILGALAVHEQRAVQERLSEQVHQEWMEQPDRHPHRVAHFGTFAFRAPVPMTVFDPGVERFVGNTTFLEAHRQNPANFASVMENTTLIRFGELSPAFLLQYLVPLLLVVLAGTAVSREREQGTALLLRAQGLGLGTLITGKTLAYAFLGLVAAGLTTLATALVLAMDGTLTLDTTQRLVALGGIYAFFLAVCAGLGIFCSALCNSSRQAMLTVTAGWLILAVMLPRSVPDWTQMAEPLPTRVEFITDIRVERAERGDGHNPDDPAFQSFREETLEEYGVDRIEDLPVNFQGLVMQEGERRDSAVYQNHYETLQTRLNRQDTLFAQATWTSPALAVRQLSSTLAGTDRQAYQKFREEAEDYRYRVMQELNELHTHEIELEDDRAQRISDEHWKAIPPFEYTPPKLADQRTFSAAAWSLPGWGALTAALLVTISLRKEGWS